MCSSELPLSCRCLPPNSFCGLRTDYLSRSAVTVAEATHVWPKYTRRWPRPREGRGEEIRAVLPQPSERRLPGARTAERGGTRRRTSGRRRRPAKRRTPSGLAVGPSASTGIHNRRDRQCANGGSADGVACTTPSELTARTILNWPPNLLIGKRPESRVFSE